MKNNKKKYTCMLLDEDENILEERDFATKKSARNWFVNSYAACKSGDGDDYPPDAGEIETFMNGWDVVYEFTDIVDETTEDTAMVSRTWRMVENQT